MVFVRAVAKDENTVAEWDFLTAEKSACKGDYSVVKLESSSEKMMAVILVEEREY